MARYRFGDVRDNVLAWLEGTGGGSGESPGIFNQLYRTEAGSWPGYEVARLRGQVTRALNDLADRGLLVKDRRDSTQVLFYTPDAWAERQAWEQQRREAENIDRHRWEKIAHWVSVRGVQLYGRTYGDPVQLSLGDWEQLITRSG